MSIITPFQTPPASFFTIEGIYAHRYDPSVVATFDTISTTVGAIGLPDPFNNLINNPPGKFMSFQQLSDYRRQIALFQRVYNFNKNQSTIQTATYRAVPYRFLTYKEKNDYDEGVGIINKLYNVQSDLGLSNIFIFKFPPFGQFSTN
jgi:hypothetical protein